MGVGAVTVNGVNLTSKADKDAFVVEFQANRLNGITTFRFKDDHLVVGGNAISIREQDELIVTDDGSRIFGGRVSTVVPTLDGNTIYWAGKATSFDVLLDERVIESGLRDGTTRYDDDDVIWIASFHSELLASTYVSRLRTQYLPSIDYSGMTLRKALATLASHTTGPVLWVDENKHVHWINPAAAQIVPNAGFDGGSSTGWALDGSAVVTADAGPGGTGDYGLITTGNGSGMHESTRTVTGITAGKRYFASIWLWSSVAAKATLRLDWQNGSSVSQRIDTITNAGATSTWAAYQAVYVAPATAVKVVVMLGGVNNFTGTVRHDNVGLVEETAAWGVDTSPDGTTTFAPWNWAEPRKSVTPINRLLIRGYGGFSGWREHAASIAYYGGKRFEGVIFDDRVVSADGLDSRSASIFRKYAFPARSGTYKQRQTGLRAGTWQIVNIAPLGRTSIEYIATLRVRWRGNGLMEYEVVYGEPEEDIGVGAAAAEAAYTGEVLTPGQPDLSTIEFADTIRFPTVVTSLPTLPDALWPQGSIVFLTTDQKLYRNTDGSTWQRRIDGDADILANTIVAGSIATGAIGADEIAANAVIAGKIAASAVVAGSIAAGAVTAEKLLIGGGRWMTNPDFETGTFDGWTVAPASGGTSAIGNDAAWRAQGRYYATITNGATIGTEVYQFVDGCKQGDVLSVSALLANADCQIGVGWYNAAGGNISYDLSAVFDSGGGYNGDGPQRWTHVTGAAPVGTVQARIIFVNKEASTGLLIDDVWLTRVGDVVNRNGNVRINAAGITIKNGALSFEDQYGSTVLTGSGFSEGWEDFLATGLYNGTFHASDASADTSDYWAGIVGTYPFEVIAKSAATSGFAWRYTPNGAAAASSSYLQSARVPVTGRMGYECVAILDHNYISGTPDLKVELRVSWYTAALGACTPAYNTSVYPVGNADTSGTARSGRFVAPADARYAIVQVFLYNTGNGNCQTDIESVALVRSLTTDYFVPPGTITLWYGETTAIPNGWYLCDGSNGTPDLRDRFIVGADSTNEGTSGGTASATASLGHPTDGGGSTGTLGLTTGTPNMAGGTVVATGSQQLIGHTHDADHGHNTPAHQHGAHAIYKFYRLCYIMKG